MELDWIEDVPAVFQMSRARRTRDSCPETARQDNGGMGTLQLWRHGVLTFHPTQDTVVSVLTGHGSFGRYLFGIRREDTPSVSFPEDTVKHTVEVCPA